MVQGITKGTGSGLSQAVIVGWKIGRRSDSLGICGIFRNDFFSVLYPLHAITGIVICHLNKCSQEGIAGSDNNLDRKDVFFFFPLDHLQVQKNLR